jgi:6-pyruvoyl-tetrahydropterin synthase
MIITTAVRSIFSASHRDPLTGAMHGHDYEVIGHYAGEPLRRFEVLKEHQDQVLKALDHTVLADDQWSAEALAPILFHLFSDPIKVEVNRPWLGHFVTAAP